jgi:murein DD-endopeptidase MepM/ murein hydrolase activator NlpD
VVNAGLLASIFGTEASANSPVATVVNPNSQTLALLQANIALPEEEAKPKGKDKSEEINEDAEVNIVSDTALLPTTGPIGVSDGTEEFDYYLEDKPSVYVVRSGDTFSKIAEMFEVSVGTILSANDLAVGSSPKVGAVLYIPSVSGIEHKVEKGQTLQGIAKMYNVEVSKIVAANIDLDANSKLTVGDKFIIPGADMLASKKTTSAKVAVKSGGSVKSSSGYFINPLPTGPRIRKTQGLHDKYAIDIGAPAGTPIYAAASGTVSLANHGWTGGYGNAVFIKHGNGTETRYAHMSKIATSTGAKVSQGQVIGYVGSTGRSTGNHLHYEVRGWPNNLNH